MTTRIELPGGEVVIYRAGDMARLAELRRAADIAERNATRVAESGTAREGDDVSAQAEKDAYDAFVDEAAERATTVRVQAIGNEPFRDLMLAHPPRVVTVKVTETVGEGEDAVEVERDREQVHEDDADYGVNVSTFATALLNYVDDEDPEMQTIAEPEFPNAAARKRFIGRELTEGYVEQLWVTAYFFNRNPSADPKMLRFSPASPRSDESTM